MKKVCILLSLALAVSCLCSGCVRYADLSDRAIVQALGIDYLPDKKVYRISMQYFAQSSEGGQNQIDKTQPNVLKSVGEGESVLTAAKNASVLSGKDLLLSENRLIIIGNELCKYDLMRTLEFFISNFHSHPQTYVVCAENTAEELIDIRFKEGYVSSQHLTSLLENAAMEGKMLHSLSYETMTRLYSSSGSAFLPRMSISKQKTDATVPKDSGGSGKSGGGGESGGNSEEEGEDTIILNGGIIFSNRVAAGVLEDKYCTALQFLCNQINEYSVTVDFKENEKSTITLFAVRTEIIPVFEKEALSFDIKVNASGRFEERGAIDETDTADIKAVTETVQEEIKAMLQEAIAIIKNKYRADAFGLEDALRHSYPQYVYQNKENIAEIILSAPCNVAVSCHTFSLGLQSY